MDHDAERLLALAEAEAWAEEDRRNLIARSHERFRRHEARRAEEERDMASSLADPRLPRAIAVCHDHAEDALEHMTARTVRVRQVSVGDARFRCGCGAPAAWFLSEVRR